MAGQVDLTQHGERPFLYSELKLLRHSSLQQVILCDYSSVHGPVQTAQCILKLFSSKARKACDIEVSAYSTVKDSDLQHSPLADVLWSGSWTADQYNEIIGGKLPSIIRPRETTVFVLMLSYIANAERITSISPGLRQEIAIKRALQALRSLHSLKILHGSVGPDNLLLLKKGPSYFAYWIDLSCSSLNASQRALSREWNDAITMFTDLLNINVLELLNETEEDEVSTPISSSSDPESVINPLPYLQDHLQFRNFELIAAGNHAFIYKVEVSNVQEGQTAVCCLKVFKNDWMVPYNLETAAYEYLLHHGVHHWIPHIYGTGVRSVAQWGLAEIDGDTDGQYYGILMEWIEGSERLSEENVRADHIVSLVRGLVRIHDAGVLHGDPYPQNMLVVPGSSRAVWIDFSCAQVNPDEKDTEDEMKYGATRPAVWFYRDSVREGESNVYNSFLATSLPLRRRVGGAIYASWIILEGIYEVVQSFDMARHALLYFITPVLVMILLRSYIGLPFMKAGFRSILLGHQLLLLAYSLWVILNQGVEGKSALTELRLSVLCFCTISELEVLAIEVAALVASVGKYTWEERRTIAARQGFAPPVYYL